jgi:hypothetical protein
LKERMRVPSPAASTIARFGAVMIEDASAIYSVLPPRRLNCV